MNPVIGLDISKEERHGQAFLDRGKPYRGTFLFEHTREGLVTLLQVVQGVEQALISIGKWNTFLTSNGNRNIFLTMSNDKNIFR